jgi:hypothetical protein
MLIGLLPLVTGIVLIGLGLLAAYSSIITRRPAPSGYVDALVPYQGWLSCLCGLSVLVTGVIFLLRSGPAGWGIAALVGALEVVLGLLLGYLGYALLTKHGEQVRRYQTNLAYLAIVLGVLTVYEMLRLYSAAPVASVE